MAAFAGGVAVLVLGVITLLILSFLRFDGRDIAFEFARDIAIALSVSGVMACLFEIYHHVTHQMRTMREVIDTVMGDKITAEVWDEVKKLIEHRNVIRRNVRIRLSLHTMPGLKKHEAVLRVEQDYDLCGLTQRRATVRVEHELDYHLRNGASEFPRFEYIEVNPPGPELKKYSRADIKTMCPEGKFSQIVTVEPSGGEPVHIQVQRFELVHIPGSYNLYSSEFIKGLQLYFGECPTEIESEVWVRPQGEGMDIKHGEKTCSCEHLLLPGQGIEIKLSKHKAAGLSEAATEAVAQVVVPKPN